MALCKRYYNRVFDAEGQSGEKPASLAVYASSSVVTTIFNFPKMRVEFKTLMELINLW